MSGGEQADMGQFLRSGSMSEMAWLLQDRCRFPFEPRRAGQVAPSSPAYVLRSQPKCPTAVRCSHQRIRLCWLPLHRTRGSRLVCTGASVPRRLPLRLSADPPAVNRERIATTSATAFARSASSPHSSRPKLGFNSGLRSLPSIGPRESRICFNSAIAFCHCFVSVIFRRSQLRFTVS